MGYAIMGCILIFLVFWAEDHYGKKINELKRENLRLRQALSEANDE
jgi:hypothetical protein